MKISSYDYNQTFINESSFNFKSLLRSQYVIIKEIKQILTLNNP